MTRQRGEQDVAKSGRAAQKQARRGRRGEAARANGAEAPRAAGRVGVIVLGMHRSGTSATTRVLNLLGCDLPKTLMGANSSNEAGHWESTELCRFNDRLLDSAGTNWHDWLELNPGWFRSPHVESFREEALGVMDAEFGASRLFVMKDPRICRLMPFWRDVLAARETEPLVVIPIRNPLEVGFSLARRNETAPELGHLLWLRHVIDAERATRGMRRFFLGYDQLIANWAGVARRAEAVLGFEWPRQSLNAAREIEEFLSPRLRHHVEEPEAVTDNPALSPWLRETYAIFRRWAKSGEEAADIAALDRIAQAIGEAAPAFGRLVASGEAAGIQVRDLAKKLGETGKSLETAAGEAQRLRGRLAEGEAELTRLRQKIADTEGALARSTREASETAELAERLRTRLAEGEAEFTRLRHRLAETESALAQRTHETEETSAELSGARKELAGLRQELAGARQALAGARADLAETRRELSGKLEEMAAGRENGQAEAGRVADGLKEHVELLARDVEAGRARTADQEARAAAQAAEARAARQAVEALRAELDAARAETQREKAAYEAARAETQREKAALETRLNARFDEIATMSRLLREADRERESLGRETAESLSRLIEDSQWALLPERVKLRRKMALVKRTGVFDPSWYLSYYGDVAETGIDPLLHYVQFGAREGRAPNARLAQADR